MMRSIRAGWYTTFSVCEVHKTLLLALALSSISACDSGPDKTRDPSARHTGLVSAPLFYVGPWGGQDDIYAVMPGDARSTLLPIQPKGHFAGENLWGLAASPDGKRLAVCRSHGGIQVLELDGVKPQRLIKHVSCCESRTEWSPDGTHLLYHSTMILTGDREYVESTRPQIFVANANTGDIHQVTKGPRFNYFPIWSKDGTQIVYASGPKDAPGLDIYLQEFPRGRTQRLTHEELDLRYMVGCPQDNMVAFVESERVGAVLKVLDISSKKVTSLTKRAYTETTIAWSPDGKQIAFSGWPDGRANYQIFIIDRDGSNERRLTPGIQAKSRPQWSPDGSQIAFKLEQEKRFDIYAIDVDGTNLKRISKGDEGGEGHVWGVGK